MTANDVIESYVTEVAVQLPRRQRNDVAFELRELLGESLQERAGAAGRDADATMAIELLNAFGRPEEVAARYRPPLTIIDPADGHAFLRATVIGLAVIWCLGLVAQLRQAGNGDFDALLALAGWWSTAFIPSLWWPGLLVTGFGAASWARRRRQAAPWRPRAGDRITGGRAGMIMGLVGILCGVLVLLEPTRLLDIVFGGRAAPAAYEALTYTEVFRHRQGPCLLVLLLLNIPLMIGVIANGRWSPRMRHLETALGLATCAAMAWTVVDGPVFQAQASNQLLKVLLVLMVAITLGTHAIKLHRSVRPAPN